MHLIHLWTGEMTFLLVEQAIKIEFICNDVLHAISQNQVSHTRKIYSYFYISIYFYIFYTSNLPLYDILRHPVHLG